MLLAWLVHSRPPIFVAPSSIARGRNGAATTLYWIGSQTNQAQTQARKHKVEASKLVFPKDRQHERLAVRHDQSTQPSEEPRPQQALAAGSPYGSLPGGPYSGHEVRPALPILSTDPAVLSSDLPNGLEGNVIIEITIDEAGNVVEKSVVQSLTPIIDSKVLAAVEKWRFRPATRDGVAIASKQDVYYHFPTSAQQQMAR
jgi:TonB family protein